MQMEITGRHFTLSDEQRELIEAALGKLERFSPRPVESVKVALTMDAGIFDADGVMFMKNQEFRAKGQGREPELAANDLIENLRTQLTKFKGKMTARQKAGSGGLGKAMGDGGDPLSEDEGTSRTFVLKDMSVEDAREAFQKGEHPFLVFRDVESNRISLIYQEKDGTLGHMEASQ